jgi:hypothetical protein
MTVTYLLFNSLLNLAVPEASAAPGPEGQKHSGVEGRLSHADPRPLPKVWLFLFVYPRTSLQEKHH